MDAVIKIALYAAVGLVLLAANLWFVRYLHDTYWRGATVSRIAPFQIIGKPDEAGGLASAMPIMLHAHLRRIVRDTRDALGALEPHAGSDVSPGRRPASSTTSVLPVRSEIGIADRGLGEVPRLIAVPAPDLKRVQTPDVRLKFGPVEATGFLPWLHGLFRQDNALEVSVAYTGGTAFVYGAAGGSDLAVYLTPDDFAGAPSDDDIAALVAYAILQHDYRKAAPVFGRFTPSGFRDLLTTIGRIAALNQRTLHGPPPSPLEYRALLPDLRRLVDTAWDWPPLIRLAGAVAENAEDYEAAAAFYAAELALVDAGDRAAREALDAKIAGLNQRAAQAAERVAEVAGTASTATVVDRIRTLLGVESLAMSAEPTIAILGGTPSKGLLADERVAVIGGATEAGALSASYGGGGTAYFDSLVHAVRLVAPDARFLFRAGTVWTTAGLLEALNGFAAVGPDIVLVTLGPLEGEAFERAFAGLAHDGGILVVIAAGNRPEQPVPFAGKPLLDRVMLVSAVTLEGEPAPFTQSDPKAFWAPGTEIPVASGAGAAAERSSGTTYAAALAAGIAARVLAEHPDLTPAKLIEALREAATPALAPPAPPILNLRNALARLAQDGI